MSGKWCSLAFLCVMFFVYTVDRALLGLLAIPIQAETGISDLRFGILNSAVFWTYAAAVPFAGLVGDRFDKRKVIGVAVLAWSLAAAFAGLACGFWSLLVIVSFAITLPQTLYGPSANALIAKEHVGTRAIALSIHQAAYYAGWFASGLLVAAALSIFGSWRGAYVVFGALGVAVGFAFVLWTNARTSAAPEQLVSRGMTDSCWGLSPLEGMAFGLGLPVGLRVVNSHRNFRNRRQRTASRTFYRSADRPFSARSNCRRSMPNG